MSEQGKSGTSTDSDEDWTVPTDHDKAIRVEVKPDGDYPVVLTISHKTDGMATKIGLTLEQIAMLQAEFKDLLNSIDNPPEARVRDANNDDTQSRGIQ